MLKWFNQQQRNARFLANFVVEDEPDEAAFCMNGEVNSHNVRQYVPKGDPPDFHYVRREARGKVTAWMGICGNGSIPGPFFPSTIPINQNVEGNAYLDMLNENIMPQLTDIFDNQFQNGRFLRLWWAQDDAPAHQLVAVRDMLLEVFQRRVIALHLPVEWPPRSPDLMLCDYFFGGYLNSGAVGPMFFFGGGGVHHFSDKQIFCDITNSVVRKCSFDWLLRWFPPNLFAAFLSSRQFADGTNKTKHTSRKHRKVRKDEVGAETGFS